MKGVLLLLLLLSKFTCCAQYNFLLNKTYAERHYSLDSLFYQNTDWRYIDSGIAVAQINEIRAIAEKNNDLELKLETVLMRTSYTRRKSMYPGPDWFTDSFKYVLQKANKHKIKQLQIRANFLLSGEYMAKDMFAEAFEHQVRMYEVLKRTPAAEFPAKRTFISYIGKLYYSYEDYKSAVTYLHLALAQPKTHKDVEELDILNTLGLAKRNAKEYDSAVYYFNKVIEGAKEEDNEDWMSIGMGNKGIAFYLMGRYDEAKPLMLQDIKASLERNDKRNTISPAIKVGHIYRIEGKTDSAHYYAKTARGLINSAWHPYQHLEPLYKLMSKLAAANGDHKAAHQYLDSALIAKDSLNKRQQVLHLINARHKVIESEYNAELKRLKTEKDLSILQRNGIIGGVIVLMIITAILIYYRNRQLKADKNLSEIKLATARQRLEDFTKTIHNKNQLLETTEAELKRLQNELHAQNGDEDLPADILYQLQRSTILTDEEWNEFRDLFEQVHPGFLYKLKKRFSALTPSEVRYISLSKLQLSNKEIANILGVSPSTVRNYRYRLLKKLNIEDSDEFNTILNSI